MKWHEVEIEVFQSSGGSVQAKTWYSWGFNRLVWNPDFRWSGYNRVPQGAELWTWRFF